LRRLSQSIWTRCRTTCCSFFSRRRRPPAAPGRSAKRDCWSGTASCASSACTSGRAFRRGGCLPAPVPLWPKAARSTWK
jgi:hypothetical protein